MEPQNTFPHSTYLSFQLKGDQPESPFQLVSKTMTDYSLSDDEIRLLQQMGYSENDIQRARLTAKVDTELEEQFKSFILFQEITTCLAYLDFHLMKYKEKNPGRELNFFLWLDSQIQEQYQWEYL